MAQTLEDLSKSIEISYKTNLTFERKLDGVLTRTNTLLSVKNISRHEIKIIRFSFYPRETELQKLVGNRTTDEGYIFKMDTYLVGDVLLGSCEIEYEDVYGKSHKHSEKIKTFIEHL